MKTGLQVRTLEVLLVQGHNSISHKNTNYLVGQITEYAGATEKWGRQPLFRVKNYKIAATENSAEPGLT